MGKEKKNSFTRFVSSFDLNFRMQLVRCISVEFVFLDSLSKKKNTEFFHKNCDLENCVARRYTPGKFQINILDFHMRGIFEHLNSPGSLRWTWRQLLSSTVSYGE
jgi:hypothetical protein